ncbi:MAG: nitrite/sulfite reductase [Pseudomonadales bacterium]|nr:nitrite/sulfite reductase [Pseudomonadales bacterium]
MYQYNQDDQRFLQQRCDQFREQTTQFLAGELPAEEFQQLRLRNGLYIQRLAPMLRIAIPYGEVSAKQLRALAAITRDFDKGYAHFTTRQNIQLNWPKLDAMPDLLGRLAEVDMHAIQTSGSCIRNITSDQFAGVATDEIADPRPWAELLRQWSTLHPEFNWLPRKFKIAITGAESDRAAIAVHDIGLRLQSDDAGLYFEVWVGGGLGRTPLIGVCINTRLEPKHLITYLTAVLRVYNQFGRRDNKYKARIKILVKAMGQLDFTAAVNNAWQTLKDGPETISEDSIARFAEHFSRPNYLTLTDQTPSGGIITTDQPFERWYAQNVLAHQQPGYAAVHISLKRTGVAPGDVSDRDLEALADLADRYSFGEARVTHEQNIVLADVEQTKLPELFQALGMHNLDRANRGLATDMICCPGGDYCSLANAKSIPVAAAIEETFHDAEAEHHLGSLSINISGCMNACGHHHVGNIGILGVDKKGEEFYQLSIGGEPGEDARIGRILGPSVARAEIHWVVQRLTQCYQQHRTVEETFNQTLDRVGIEAFKSAAYEGLTS